MGNLLFLFLFFSQISSTFSYPYMDVEVGWNATNYYQESLSNGRSYCPTGLGLQMFNTTTIKEEQQTMLFRLLFLGDQRNGQSNLSIVAWNYDIWDVEDVTWTAAANKAVGINATLQLQADGLVLKDENKVTVWSTNTTGVSRMRLTQYGALLLLDSNNKTLWSSFKNPTDKLVCGQVLEYGMELASGDYRFRAEKTGAALYFQKHMYRKWNFTYDSSGITFVALCCDGWGPTLQLGYDTGNISDAGYYTQNYNFCGYRPTVDYMMWLWWGSNTSTVSYETVLSLEGNGVLTLKKLSPQTSNFQGNDSCNLPNICGQFGVCSPIDGSCSCPLNNSAYFKHIDDSNEAAGCALASDYTNSSDSGSCKMINQTGIDYYETSFSSPSLTGQEAECYKKCLDTPNCVAAFYHHNTSDCFLVNHLYSLKASNNSYSASFKLCKIKTNETTITKGAIKTKGTNIVLIASVAAGAGVLLCILICVIGFVVKLKREDGEEEDSILTSYLSEATLTRFSLKEIEQITSSFSEKLGNGAFGTVYKGQLPNGNYVAVKILNGSRQQAQDFYAELTILGRVHHFNLVQLLGFCSNKTTRALVYEYMANRSLDHWLVGENTTPLSWEARMEIAIGAARGMAYLHEECLEKVLHLDVKPQNILLDDNFYPKVADFGLSRLLDRGEDHFFMTTICGTPGYLAPELMRGEAIGVESDIYSFGVVLLEILAGVKPPQPNGEEYWKLSKNDHVVKSLVDSRLDEAFILEQAKRVIRIAALCLNHDPYLRPHMSSVVQMLEGSIEIPEFVSTVQFFPKIQPTANDEFMALLESRARSSSSSQVIASTSMSRSILLPR